MRPIEWLRWQVRVSWCEAFEVFDRNGDGRISLRELHETLDALGEPVPQERVRELLERADQDGDGLLDVDEFAHVLAGQGLPPHVRDELALSFRVFDADDDGSITKDELRQVLEGFGASFDDDEIGELFAECDADADGLVNFAEFHRTVLGA